MSVNQPPHSPNDSARMKHPYSASPFAQTNRDFVTESHQVNAAIIESFGTTRTWVLICAIAGFILSAILIYSATQIHGYIGFLGIIYVILSFLTLFPSIKLYNYSAALKRLKINRCQTDLIKAIRHQTIFAAYCAGIVLLWIAFFIFGLFFSL